MDNSNKDLIDNTREPDAWIPSMPISVMDMTITNVHGRKGTVVPVCPEILKQKIEEVGWGEVERLEMRDSKQWPWSQTAMNNIVNKEQHYRIPIYFKNLDEKRQKFFENGGVITYWYTSGKSFVIQKYGVLLRSQIKY